MPILAALALAWAALMGPGPQHAQAGAGASPTLTIVRPAEGPVGANLAINVTGAAGSQQYNFGYAPQGKDCTAPNYTVFSGAPPITTDQSGSYTGIFTWPAGSGKGSFFLCAQNATQASDTLQSATVYTVDSTSAPSISLAHAPTPAPTAGGVETTPTAPAPTATPEPDGYYTVNDDVIISGANFFPAGSALEVWISDSQGSLGRPLNLVNGDGSFNSDTSGAFQKTVALPTFLTGQVYLHVTTTDATNSQTPVLRADGPRISVNLAPTPTPTPIATVTPTPKPRTTATPGGGGSNTGVDGRTLGVAGLGAFSVLLLIIGTILLVSAGAMQRDEG